MHVFFEHAVWDAAIVTGLIVACGTATAHILRKRHLRWTWALPGVPVGFLLLSGNPLIALPLWGASLYACALGLRWHREDLEHGADHAEIAHARLGIVGMIRRRQSEVRIKRDGWISNGQLVVGRDERGLPASIPVGYGSGSHTLVVGATGSGKTISEAGIACRLIDGLHRAVVIDPK